MLSRPSPKFIKRPTAVDRIKDRARTTTLLRGRQAHERRFASTTSALVTPAQPGCFEHVLSLLESPHHSPAVMRELLEYINYEKLGSGLPWTPAQMAAILNQCARFACSSSASTITFLDLATCVFHPHAGLFPETELLDMLLLCPSLLDVLYVLLDVADIDGNGQTIGATAALVLRDVCSCGATAAQTLATFHQPFLARVFAIIDSNPPFPLWCHVMFLEEMLLRLPPSEAAASALFRFLPLAFRKDCHDSLFRSNVMRAISNLIFTMQERDYFVAAVNNSELIPKLMAVISSSRSPAEMEAGLVLYAELVSCNESWAVENDCIPMLLLLLQSPHVPGLQTTMLWVINVVLGTLSIHGSLRVLACKPLVAWIIRISARGSAEEDDRSFAFQCLRACLYDASFCDENQHAWFRLVELAVSEGVVEALLRSLADRVLRLRMFPDSIEDIDFMSNRDCLRLARKAFPTLLAHLYPELN